MLGQNNFCPLAFTFVSQTGGHKGLKEAVVFLVVLTGPANWVKGSFGSLKNAWERCESASRRLQDVYCNGFEMHNSYCTRLAQQVAKTA